MAGLLNTLKKNWRGLLDEVQAAPESLRALTQPAAAQQFDAALRKGGTIDKEKAVQMAMDVLQTTPMGVMGKIVYHGSPHKFDKFDMSKIGTGEGAQAYGHGLYMAETPDVAQTYKQSADWRKKTMDQMRYLVDGKEVMPKGVDDGLLYHYRMSAPDLFAERIQHLKKQKAGSIDQAKYYAEQAKLGDDPERYARMAKRAQETAKKFDEELQLAAKLQNQKVEAATGNLYKVDIPDEAVSRMLDWDKPLSEQAPEVRAALKNAPTMRLRDGMAIPGGGKLKVVQDEDFGTKYFIDYGDQKLKITEPEVRNLLGGGTEGKSLFSELINTYGPKKAEDWLRAKGIPGIRYLDGGSRTAGEGTSNFVLFDDQLPRILERNGIPTGLNPWAPGEWRGLLEP